MAVEVDAHSRGDREAAIAGGHLDRGPAGLRPEVQGRLLHGGAGDGIEDDEGRAESAVDAAQGGAAVQQRPGAGERDRVEVHPGSLLRHPLRPPRCEGEGQQGPAIRRHETALAIGHHGELARTLICTRHDSPDLDVGVADGVDQDDAAHKIRDDQPPDLGQIDEVVRLLQIESGERDLSGRAVDDVEMGIALADSPGCGRIR